MVSNDQRILSKRVQLLHELGYSDPDLPYRASGVNCDVRFLDTVAVALTTGKPGDVFAAALDKHEHMQVILAKNGSPTSQDVAAANELISLIGSPTVAHAMDLFPFLLRRCGANIDKRIHSLYMSIHSGELREDFRLALQAYIPSDIQAEFPGEGTILGDYGDDTVPPFSRVWRDLVEEITEKTIYGQDAENISSSTSTYARLFILANTLVHSRFLKTLADDRNVLHKERKERIEKLKRYLGKVCQ